MKKRIFALILALALACSLLVFPANAAEVLDSGTYQNGSNKLEWVLTSDGTVTISGTGFIDEFLKNSWSQWNSIVKSIVIEPGATGIGQHAFYLCSDITSVTIPQSVTFIGSQAFYNCRGLTSVTIPGSVTSIGSNAFQDCVNLTSVTILDGVTGIGQYAFSGCKGLTDVWIPESVTSIGDYAFSNCRSLVSIAIPDGVTRIGNNAFTSCSSLKSVMIPDSVKTIGYSVFSCCSSLESVTIPESVTSIGGYAFQSCVSLESVTIPNSVSKINEYTFDDCTSLIRAVLPESVTSIERYAFSGCSSLKSVIIPGSVTSIGGSAFQNCSSLETVTISEGVTSIGYAAFSGCSNLPAITFPASVTSIDTKAFEDCSSLTEINVDPANTSYRSVDGVLFNASGTQLLLCPLGRTKGYMIPDGTLLISDRAFSECSVLTEVTIPDSVVLMGVSAFSNCSALERVTIGHGVSSIPDSAFSACSSLTSVTIPNSVSSIGNSAFYQCSSLTSVTIPDSVTSIGNSGFYGCSSLMSVTIPDGVTNIGENAFKNCSSLMSVTIPDSVTVIEYGVFGFCSSLTTATIPDSVTRIGYGAFSTCSSLKDVYYGGNEDQWAAISIGVANNSLTDATIHFGAFTPGKIESNPVDVTALAGETVSLSVTASGDVVSYQWQISENGIDWTDLPDSTAATLEFVAEDSMNGNQYRCVITDKDENTVASASAALTVVQPVTITASPIDSVGRLGGVAAFAVEAEGDGLTYQWQFSDDGGETWTDSAVTAQVYTTKLTSARDGRLVRCIVTDRFGFSATSDTAEMRIGQTNVTITAHPVNYIGKVNSTASFHVTAAGEGLTYQWQFSDNGGSSWKKSSVTTDTYSAKLNTMKDGRLVRCVVTDKYGNSVTSDPASMEIAKIRIVSQPQDFVGKKNDTAVFYVDAQGDGLTYQWQISDNDGEKWSKSSVTTLVYVTKLSATRDGRQVRCVIKDEYGNSVTTDVATMSIG